MLSLDKRLSACAEFVSENSVVCDVGTDHAYLIAYLVNSGKTIRGIACDINDGPLKSAKQTLTRYSLLEKVDVVKSDGLKGIINNGITHIVIAGMGAELIADIVGAVDWIDENINLILQPMTHIPFLRKWIYNNGYEIIDEKFVEDNKTIYTIMKVKFSGVKVEIDDCFATIGKISVGDEISIKYATKELNRIERILEGLKNSKDKESEIYYYKKLYDDINEAILG